MREWQPDLAIGTTPVVQAAKQASIPSLYFTNLISARPLMGPAGAGSLAQVINAAIGNKARFDQMSGIAVAQAVRRDLFFRPQASITLRRVFCTPPRSSAVVAAAAPFKPP